MLFPLPSLLQQISYELRVPGQDALATFVMAASGYCSVGLRFNPTTGNIDVQKNGVVIDWNDTDVKVTSDMWIHSESKSPPRFNPAAYEARFVNVTGDTAKLATNVTWGPPGYGADDYYHDLTVLPHWYAYANTTFGLTVVSGIIQVREKANHANSRSGQVEFRAAEIGF